MAVKYDAFIEAYGYAEDAETPLVSLYGTGFELILTVDQAESLVELLSAAIDNAATHASSLVSLAEFEVEATVTENTEAVDG